MGRFKGSLSAQRRARMAPVTASIPSSLPATITAMINAAVIALGRWGKNIVEAVQGKSPRLRIVRGVSKEPDLVRDFAAKHDFQLTTEFEEAIADPRVQAVFLATPHSLHLRQIEAVAALGK